MSAASLTSKQASFFVYNAEGEKIENPLLLEEFQKGDECAILSCGHVFLESDVREWAKTQTTSSLETGPARAFPNCPTCRREFILPNKTIETARKVLSSSSSSSRTSSSERAPLLGRSHNARASAARAPAPLRAPIIRSQRVKHLLKGFLGLLIGAAILIPIIVIFGSTSIYTFGTAIGVLVILAMTFLILAVVPYTFYHTLGGLGSR